MFSWYGVYTEETDDYVSVKICSAPVSASIMRAIHPLTSYEHVKQKRKKAHHDQYLHGVVRHKITRSEVVECLFL